MPSTRKHQALPLAIVHPSASYRHGLAGAFDPAVFAIAEPTDLAGWLRGGTQRIAIIADGSAKALLAERSESTIAVVLLDKLDLDQYRHVLASGADGVAHIDSQPSTIADIVRAAVAGEVVLPAEVARQLAGKPRPATVELTGEERELLQRLSEGATVVQLADEFYLAERSVRRRLQNVYLRLGVGGRAEALKLVSQLGLVS